MAVYLGSNQVSMLGGQPLVSGGGIQHFIYRYDIGYNYVDFHDVNIDDVDTIVLLLPFGVSENCIISGYAEKINSEWVFHYIYSDGTECAMEDGRIEITGNILTLYSDLIDFDTSGGAYYLIY